MMTLKLLISANTEPKTPMQLSANARSMLSKSEANLTKSEQNLRQQGSGQETAASATEDGEASSSELELSLGYTTHEHSPVWGNTCSLFDRPGSHRKTQLAS